MKRRILVLLIIMFCFLTAFSEENSGEVRTPVDGWYIQNAWKMVETLSRLADDEGYIAMYGVEYFGDIINEMRSCIPSEMPPEPYFISVSGMNESLLGMFNEDYLNIEPENLRMILRGLPNLIRTMLVAQEGANAVAASSILQAGEGFILPDVPFEPGFIVFDGGQKYVAVVTVSAAGEGVVSFTAGLISRDSLKKIHEIRNGWNQLAGQMMSGS